MTEEEWDLPSAKEEVNPKKKDGSQISINENYRFSCENLTKRSKILATHMRRRAWLRQLPRGPTATKHKTSRPNAHKTGYK